MNTEFVIAGSGELRAIVWTPAPGMAKSIVLLPPVAALDPRIACRSDPGPLSAVVLTSKRSGGDHDLARKQGDAIGQGLNGQRDIALKTRRQRITHSVHGFVKF